MKKMQPVPAQDRPKLIAVTVGIGVALTFVVRNLGGIPIQAHSGEPGTAGANTAPSAVASATALPQPSGLPASSPGEPAGPGFGSVEALPLTDPFHPIPIPVPVPESRTPLLAVPRGLAVPPASIPAQPVEVVAPRRARPVRIAALPDRVMPATPASAAVDPQPALPAAGSFEPVRLCGTVGQGRSGVALWRMEGGSLFARVGESVGEWRITGIRMGQVKLARAAASRLVRVGETLPEEALPAGDPKAAGA